MVELQHRPSAPPSLIDYLAQNPSPPVSDFDDLKFRPVKLAVRQALHQDQGGLCVYCEKRLEHTEGQVEHIKPKAGRNGHPALCFTYTNYAHSCINSKTCGQRKRDGLLPIEPAPGCNSKWTLSTDGTIEPINDLNKSQRHLVIQTRDMLGLNRDSNLVDERKRWFARTLDVLRDQPGDIQAFLQTAPYRYILARSSESSP